VLWELAGSDAMGRSSMTPSVRPWPAATIGLVAITLLFAAGLIFQPLRWAATPAYGNLLVILSAPAWGLAYLAVSAALALVVITRSRTLAVVAHVLAFVLMLTWEAAFIVRWATDPKTTIANVAAWGAYLGLVVFSARHIDPVEHAAVGDVEP
jgi:hypothetical protein